MAPGTRILLPARAQREAPGPRRAGFPGDIKGGRPSSVDGLHTAEPYFHEDSSTALESTGRHASALRHGGQILLERDCRDRSTNTALLPDLVRGVRVSR